MKMYPKKYLAAAVLSAALILPSSALAMAMVPKGMVPNNPPLQPHSPLVTPDISQNVSTPTTSPRNTQNPKPTPAAPSSPANISQQPAQPPPDTVPDLQSTDTGALWAQPWLWGLILLLGCSLGYWFISRDKNNS